MFETKYLGQKEGDYIEELCKEAGTFKLHQLNPDSKHEFCDIIKVQDSKIYIIHVKVGTGVAIRELTQQIDLSAIRFRETRASLEQTYFDDIYDSLYINGRSKGVTKEYFTNLLKNGEVYFVAMICSNKGEVDLAEAIDSSIAQYSLVNLIYQKNSYGYPVCLYPMLV